MIVRDGQGAKGAKGSRCVKEESVEVIVIKGDLFECWQEMYVPDRR